MTMPTLAPVAPPALAGLIRLDPAIGPISDEQLERVCAQNPGWKFELSATGELVINVYAGDESSDVGTELGRQVGNWRIGGGGGRARDASAGYRLSDETGPGPLLEPDVSWVSPERLAAASRDDLRGAMNLSPGLGRRNPIAQRPSPRPTGQDADLDALWGAIRMADRSAFAQRLGVSPRRGATTSRATDNAPGRGRARRTGSRLPRDLAVGR